jgi:nucleotide-binding universal stress UspA family protein
LIVMGTHGRSGISRVMLGSVTERVMRETSRPVLTVRQKKGSAAPPVPASIKNLLCPVNFNEVSRQVILQAAAVAECFGAVLTVLHIIEPHLSQTVVEAEAGRLSNWIPSQLRQACELKEVVLKGNPAEQILSTASSSGSDMIVLGAQHKRFFDSTVLGTTTVRVMRHAPCPVLTVVQR